MMDNTGDWGILMENADSGEKLETDRQTVLMAVSLNGEKLQFACDRFVGAERKRDAEVVWSAVTRGGLECLNWVRQQLSEDVTLVTKILELNATRFKKEPVKKILRYVSEEMKNSREFILGAIGVLGVSYLEEVDLIVNNDIEFAKDLVLVNPKCLEKMEPKIIEQITQSQRIISELLRRSLDQQTKLEDETLKDNKTREILAYVDKIDIITEALKIDGLALQFVRKELLTEELVEIAIKQNGMSLLYGTEKSKQNLDFILRAIDKLSTPQECEKFIHELLTEEHELYPFAIPIVFFKFTNFEPLYSCILSMDGYKVVEILESKEIICKLLDAAGTNSMYIFKCLQEEQIRDIDIIVRTMTSANIIGNHEAFVAFSRYLDTNFEKAYAPMLLLYVLTSSENVLEILKNSTMEDIEVKYKSLLGDKATVLELLPLAKRNAHKIYGELVDRLKWDEDIVYKSVENSPFTTDIIPHMESMEETMKHGKVVSKIAELNIRNHFDYVDERLRNGEEESFFTLLVAWERRDLVLEILEKNAIFCLGLPSLLEDDDLFKIEMISANLEVYNLLNCPFGLLKKGLKRRMEKKNSTIPWEDDLRTRIKYLMDEKEVVGTAWRVEIRLKNANTISNCINHLLFNK